MNLIPKIAEMLGVEIGESNVYLTGVESSQMNHLSKSLKNDVQNWRIKMLDRVVKTTTYTKGVAGWTKC